jgi:hypothetical protein
MNLKSQQAGQMIFTWNGIDIPYGSRNMDQCIRSIQDGQKGLMAIHEPLLDLDLRYWEQEAQPRELLKLQHGQRVVLGHIPDRGLREDGLGEDARAAVESVSDDPIEHLDQEGEPLQKSTVVVV